MRITPSAANTLGAIDQASKVERTAARMVKAWNSVAEAAKRAQRAARPQSGNQPLSNYRNS